MNEIKEDVQIRQGLSKDDWELTLKELKGQLTGLKLQLAVVTAGIRQVEEEITLYD